MLDAISNHIKQTITQWGKEDSIILNQEMHQINQQNFHTIPSSNEDKTIAFIDGGQAEILQTGNFCLSLIRVAIVIFKKNIKIGQKLHEFYLFTSAVYHHGELYYQARTFFKDKILVREQDLFVSSNDPSLKSGLERAPVQKISSMARRFAELALAAESNSDFIILDGALDKTYINEENYLKLLNKKASALAKTSSLFTVNGNSPATLLKQLHSKETWFYAITENTALVKLHPQANHIFRFEGNREILPFLISNSHDALFLGYPYGLMLADKLARVSHQEKNSLIARLLLKSDNKIISEYLQNTNAHEILDNLG